LQGQTFDYISPRPALYWFCKVVIQYPSHWVVPPSVRYGWVIIPRPCTGGGDAVQGLGVSPAGRDISSSRSCHLVHRERISFFSVHLGADPSGWSAGWWVSYPGL